MPFCPDNGFKNSGFLKSNGVQLKQTDAPPVLSACGHKGASNCHYAYCVCNQCLFRVPRGSSAVFI